MNFETLYTTELDRELGTADNSVRFTVVRRKAAINAAQLEWAERTGSTTIQKTVTLSDETQEYDLDTLVTDFLSLSPQGTSIKIVDVDSDVRYIEGDDLQVTTVAKLDHDEPGWRAVSASTPTHVYPRRDGGKLFLGFHPAPDITAGDTWTALVGCVVAPTELSGDADEPFSVNGNPLTALKPYHRALVHFAAYDLEKFRKDTQRGAIQLQLFESYVERYRASLVPKGGQSVRFVRNYRGRSPRNLDPRIFP